MSRQIIDPIELLGELECYIRFRVEDKGATLLPGDLASILEDIQFTLSAQPETVNGHPH